MQYQPKSLQNMDSQKITVQQQTGDDINLSQKGLNEDISNLPSVRLAAQEQHQHPQVISQNVKSGTEPIKKQDLQQNKKSNGQLDHEMKNINNVFYIKSNRTFYVPVYLRMVVKSIKSIDFQALQGSLNLTIIINVNTYGLPQQLVSFIEDNITLGFNRNESINLKNQNKQSHFCKPQDIKQIQNAFRIDPQQSLQKRLQRKEEQKAKQKKQKEQKQKNQKQQNKQKMPLKQKKQNKDKKGQKKGDVKIGFKVTIRKIMNATLEPYVFFTPFELIDLVVSIEMRDLKYNENSNDFYYIKFNIMGLKQEKLSEQSEKQLPIRTKMLSDGGTNDYGVYSVANRRLAVEYSNNAAHQTLMSLGKNFYNIKFLDIKRQRTNQKDESAFIESIKYGHFHIPLSRNPITVLTTLFIPLWLFSIINLSIFTLPPSLGGRIGAISTIMLAFVSLIPSIRQQIPTSPTLTIFQMLVYLQTVTSVLVLLQSLTVQNQDESASYSFMRSYQPAMDERYNLSFFITLIIIAIPLVMYLWYQAYLKRSHYFLKGAKNQPNDKTFQNWTQSVGNQKFKTKFKNIILAGQDLQKYKLPQIEKSSTKLISAFSLVNINQPDLRQIGQLQLKFKSGVQIK